MRLLRRHIPAASYRYDHAGRRIQKTENGVTTNYLYDGDTIHAEYPSTSWAAPAAVHVQAGADRPLARLTGATNLPTATAAYYHADGLGSVLATTGGNKAITATQRFDAFGVKLTGGVGAVPVYGYTGREPDATGLVYYRARYYDPALGRFASRDPIGLAGGINPYAYMGGNPVNLVDPSGLFGNAVSNRATQAVSYFTMGDFSQTFGETVDAFGGAAQRNPALSFAASPAEGVNQGIQSGSAGQVAFEVATADIPGAKAGLTLGGLVVGKKPTTFFINR